MHSTIRSLAIATTALLLAACSGGADRPPPIDDVDDAPATVDDSLTTAADAGATTESVCEEGSTARCLAPVAFESGGYVQCVASKKTCSQGQWTACAARAPVAQDPAWQPEDVGCAWPPQPCAQDGATHTCKKELAPTPYTANCTYVTEVCFGGVWRPCSPEE